MLIRVVGMGLLLTVSAAWGAESTLKFRLNADPPTLDWTLAHTSLETYLIMNLMEGLAEEGAEGQPVPALAERWDVSPDGKTYTFYLRKGVTWSDGAPLTAKDFEESWFRLMNPSLKASYADYLDDVQGAEAFRSGRSRDRKSVGIRALDAHRFEVKLRRRVPHFPHLVTFWVTFPIRADLLKKNGAQWTAPGKLATLGPYRLESWKKNQLITLKKNPSYYGSSALPPGTADRVEAIIELDEKTARASFEAGKIDFLLNATTQDFLKNNAQQPGQIRVAQFPYLATYYLGFNTRKPLFKDPEIRRAFASVLAIDEFPTIMQGGESAGRSWIPPGIGGYDATAPVRMTITEARQVLAKAGYVEGHGFPKLTIWMEPFDGAEAAGKHLVASLRAGLGVESELKLGPLSEMKAAGFPVPLFVGHWGADFADPETMLGVFVQGSGTNYTGWVSGEYDKLVETARSSGSRADRMKAYLDAQRMLMEREVPVVPLFYKKNTVLLGTRIQDFSISPLNYLFLKNITLKGEGAQAPSPK